MNRIYLLLLLLLAAVAVPFAAADTIQLTQNSLGIGGTIGTVTLIQKGGNVSVTLKANAGYSFKTGGGGDILFNTNATGWSISGLKIDGHSATWGLSTVQTRAGYTFAYDMTGLSGPKSLESATTITFTISNITVAQLEQTFKNRKKLNPFFWSVHFCVGGQPEKCSDNTGFAYGNTITPTVVPEPGTLSLLGTGLVGIAGLMRRRFFA